MNLLSSMNGPSVLTSMNDVEIMGADIASVLDSLGAPAEAQQVRTALQRMRAAKQVDPQSIAVMEAAYKSVAIMPLGFPATTFLAASGSGPVSIEVKSSRPVKPVEVVIPSTISPFFVMASGSIAGTDMISGGSIPFENYSSSALRSHVSWPTINTATPLNMNVSMVDLTADRVFRGMIQGPTLLK